MAWARRARDSLAALENVVLTLETFSIPTPNVLTSFLTKFKVCGVMVASATEICTEHYLKCLVTSKISTKSMVCVVLVIQTV